MRNLLSGLVLLALLMLPWVASATPPPAAGNAVGSPEPLAALLLLAGAAPTWLVYRRVRRPRRA